MNQFLLLENLKDVDCTYVSRPEVKQITHQGIMVYNVKIMVRLWFKEENSKIVVVNLTRQIETYYFHLFQL